MPVIGLVAGGCLAGRLVLMLPLKLMQLYIRYVCSLCLTVQMSVLSYTNTIFPFIFVLAFFSHIFIFGKVMTNAHRYQVSSSSPLRSDISVSVVPKTS